MEINFKNWLESTEINWTLPVVSQEMFNIQKSTQSLKLDPTKLNTALNNAKLVNLPNNIWDKAKNLTTTPKPVFLPKSITKQLSTLDLSANTKQKIDLRAPIIIMNNNQPYIVSGQDSFQAARNLGTYPKALVASL